MIYLDKLVATKEAEGIYHDALSWCFECSKKWGFYIQNTASNHELERGVVPLPKFKRFK